MTFSELRATLQPRIQAALEAARSFDFAEKLEASNSLTDLAAILQRQDPNAEITVDTIRPLEDFLADRWNTLRHTHLASVYHNANPVTDVFSEIAKTLQTVSPKDSHYQYLFPTLEVTSNDISCVDISDLEPHEFILSDDATRFIDIDACFEYASESGSFNHSSTFVDAEALERATTINERLQAQKPRKLSATELERLIAHSEEAKAVYQATMDYYRFRKNAGSYGSALDALIVGLRRGGAHANETPVNPENSNDIPEFNAAHNANEAIFHFHQWLETLTKAEKAFLFSLTSPRINQTKSDDPDQFPTLAVKNFGDLWERLHNPVRYTDVMYCVEIIADKIETITEDLPSIFDKYPEAYENGKKPGLYQVLEDAKKESFAALQKAVAEKTLTPSKKSKASNQQSTQLLVNLLSRDINTALPNDIKNVVDLVIKHFPKEARYMALKPIITRLPEVYQDGDSLVELLDKVAINDRLPLLSELHYIMPAMIDDAHQLTRVLAYLPTEDNRLALLHRYYGNELHQKIKTKKDLLNVLYTLSTHRISKLNIKNTKELKEIIKKIDSELTFTDETKPVKHQLLIVCNRLYREMLSQEQAPRRRFSLFKHRSVEDKVAASEELEAALLSGSTAPLTREHRGDLSQGTLGVIRERSTLATA